MKISINLLPPEIIAKELKRASFYRIQLAGIAVILTTIFLASLTGALRILQSHNITVIEAKLAQAEQRASDLKDTQASLMLLKNRLTVIDRYLGVASNQSSMYKLIEQLVPPAVVINEISIGKDGKIVLLAFVPDSLSLDDLIDRLTLKENNEDKISQVSVESLNRGRDGFYRISLKIKPK